MYTNFVSHVFYSANFGRKLLAYAACCYYAYHTVSCDIPYPRYRAMCVCMCVFCQLTDHFSSSSLDIPPAVHINLRACVSDFAMYMCLGMCICACEYTRPCVYMYVCE